MSRRAHRLTDPAPLRHPLGGVSTATVAGWAGLILSLAVALSLTLWLASSGVWSGLRSSIESLDFDPVRATLILAWLAGMVLAAVATALGGGALVEGLPPAGLVAPSHVLPFRRRV